tara:strand:+ start:3169 stop:4251 length:1083 start_codon:yes stop_codon:yes gene_type:complete
VLRNWASEELAKEESSRLRRLSAEGLGRRRIARQIAEQTGRGCTSGVVGNALGLLGIHKPRTSSRVYVLEPSPPEDHQATIEELLEDRKKAYRRKANKAKFHERTLQLSPEPFGILLHGDPHLDDDGCDFEAVVKYLELAQQTEGMFGATVGDALNLWIGRLAKKYADSSLLASDGWRLTEWFINSHSAGFLAFVFGNHDSWAAGQGVDPMSELCKKTGVIVHAPDEIRITFTWKGRPELEPIIWILRHDFSGRSYFHPTHGPHKEAIFDGRAHILTAGHIHQWGELTTEQRHGRVSTALRVRGYKRCDEYAKQKGFYEQEHGYACVIVIDPESTGPGRIKVFWDIEQGCDYLTFIRGAK